MHLNQPTYWLKTYLSGLLSLLFLLLLFSWGTGVGAIFAFTKLDLYVLVAYVFLPLARLPFQHLPVVDNYSRPQNESGPKSVQGKFLAESVRAGTPLTNLMNAENGNYLVQIVFDIMIILLMPVFLVYMAIWLIIKSHLNKNRSDKKI